MNINQFLFYLAYSKYFFCFFFLSLDILLIRNAKCDILLRKFCRYNFCFVKNFEWIIKITSFAILNVPQCTGHPCINLDMVFSAYSKIKEKKTLLKKKKVLCSSKVKADDIFKCFVRSIYYVKIKSRIKSLNSFYMRLNFMLWI